MPPVINLEKSKAAMDKQKELNSTAPPPAGKWAMVITTVEVRAAGKGTIHKLGAQLLHPVAGIHKDEQKRAEALEGRGRIYVDLWVPSDTDGPDSPAALRYGCLLTAVGATKVPNLEKATDVAGAITGVPFLGTFEHSQRGQYRDTRLLEVLPIDPKKHGPLLAKLPAGKLAEKVADRVVTRQARGAGGASADPHGDLPPVESYGDLV